MREHGFSLFELLIALSILAVAASLAGAAISVGMRERQLDQAADQLVHDLEQARLDARLAGHAITLQIQPRGYEVVGAADRSVRWPSSVSAEWAVVQGGRTRSVDRVEIPPQPVSALHLVVTLTDTARTTQVEMSPYSARIDRDPITN